MLVNKNGLLAVFSVLVLACVTGFSAPMVSAVDQDQLDRSISDLKKDYSSGAYENDHSQSPLTKELSDVFNSRNDEQGFPQKIEKTLGTQATTTGEMGEIERYIRLVMNKSVKLRNDYMDELTAIGWDTLLDGKRLENDKDMVESKAVIERARGVVERFKARTEQMFADNLKGIDGLNISAQSKKSFREGYLKASVARKERVSELWQLESQIIAEAESIIYHLEARRAHWSLEEGKLMFEKQNDLDIYLSYLQAIKDLSARQEAIQKQSMDTALKKLDLIR